MLLLLYLLSVAFPSPPRPKNPTACLVAVRRISKERCGDGNRFQAQEFHADTDGQQPARFSHPQRIGAEIVGRVWSFLDITAQHQAEQRIRQLSQVIVEELAKSERERGQLQALLASIPDLVWMKDAKGVFLTALKKHLVSH